MWFCKKTISTSYRQSLLKAKLQLSDARSRLTTRMIQFLEKNCTLLDINRERHNVMYSRLCFLCKRQRVIFEIIKIVTLVMTVTRAVVIDFEPRSRLHRSPQHTIV